MTGLVLAALAVATFGYMLLPIFRQERSPAPIPKTDQRSRYLEEKREQILENIVDLDGEFQMGRLAPVDYERLREESVREAIDVEQKLSSESGKTAVRPQSRANEEKARADQTATQTSAGSWYCGQCGSANPRENSFCNECGAKIRA